jgi:hypothetical protein
MRILRILVAGMLLLSCSAASQQGPPLAPAPSSTNDPRVEVSRRLNDWITSWNAAVAASKEGEVLSLAHMPFLADISPILQSADAAGAPLPSSFNSAVVEFIQTLDAKNSLADIPELWAGSQRKLANLAMAELRRARTSYPALVDPLDYPLPKRVAEPAHDLVLTIAGMPVGVTVRGEMDCRSGSIGDCWQRSFDHPRYVVIVEVSKFGTTELAQAYLQLANKPDTGGRPMALGEVIGDASGGWSRAEGALQLYYVASRLANSVAFVYVGGALGTDPSLSVDILKRQVERIRLSLAR